MTHDELDELGAESESRRRGRTMSRKEMARQLRRARKEDPDPGLHLIMDEVVQIRPKSRAECISLERPCLFVSCKYHLYLDVNPRTGSIKLNFPDKEIWEIGETCALDVADKGGITLEEVGDIMNLTRERIRQVEVSGLGKLKDATCPEDE